MTVFGTLRLNMARALLCVGLALMVSTVAAAQSAPSAYTTGYRYDLMGRVLGTISPSANGTAAPFLATRNTYDADGRLVTVETGSLAAWQGQTVAPASWPNFTVYKTTVTSYDALDRKLIDVTFGADRNAYEGTQYSYDVVGRVQCTAERMNLALFPQLSAGALSGGSLPGSACTLGQPGTQGADRITQNVYDPASRVLQVQRAVGITTANGYPANLQQNYVSYTYTPNGRQASVLDANGNLAAYTYDGFDRLTQWNFPSPTAAGQTNALDYETYSYDANGNRLTLRKREGSVLTYQYDGLDRVTSKVLTPSSSSSSLPATDVRPVYYSYDALGHQLTAWFDSATSGQGVTNAFDGFGRQISTSLTMDTVPTHTVNYCYDADSDRTLVSYPDSTVGTCPASPGTAATAPVGWTNYAQTTYDGLDRPLAITTSAGTTPASYAYNADGTRSSFKSNGTAVNTGYTYDPVDRLSGLTNTPVNASYANSFTFSYNPGSQIAALTKSNNAFVYNGAYNVSRAYTVNGLNQYATVAGTAFTYDMNGNLIGDGTNTYRYDIENRLVAGGAALSATLRYDPLGRLYEVVGSSGTTRFFYGGDELMAEYDGSGNLLRRYVHGADLKSDDPIAWYEGAAFASTNERLLRANWQGSIELVAGTTGGAIYGANTYDEYGVPGTNNVGRFQYTGQAWIPELGMNYYKARMYSPTLGRFMQTDPIAYQDHVNLYAYVANDPMDKSDTTGDATVYDFPYMSVIVQTVDNKSQFSDQQIGAQGGNLSGTDAAGRSVTVVLMPGNDSDAAHIRTNSGLNDTSSKGADRSHTDQIGGRQVDLAPNAAGPVTVGHELGHVVGAGDQYPGGVDANGHTVTTAPPNSQNTIMRDLGGPANSQTVNEMEAAPTNRHVTVQNEYGS